MTKEISKRMQERLQLERLEARKRVIERGLVQFRAGKSTMEQLLTVAEYKGVPVGVLIRNWVEPILKQEYEDLPLERIILRDGNVITADTSYRELQKVFRDYISKSLELTAKEATILKDWLLSGCGRQDEAVSEIILADGRVLSPKSSYKELVSVFKQHKLAKLDLTPFQYNVIVDWTIRQAEAIQP
jgi:hypothetical protein